ncbi:MAG TPA: MerR family transcriptional regulator, partial [Alphaproteobacteria bacterium]|nr:MerR family transcriptional regulator [Alphaproteobacteria bacterium]
MEQSAAVLHSEESHKSSLAFRTISEVSHEIDVPQHVLRFWESRFTQVKPLKRGGGRRYYRPEDVALLRRIKDYLYKHGYTIKGVQRLLKEHRHGLPAAELAGLGPMGGVQEAVPDFADGYNPALHEQNEAQPQNAL